MRSHTPTTRGNALELLIVGTGYVGLVTGACFAEMGHHVTCLDIDEKKIALLREGKSPIYEPGLQEILLRNLQAGRLSFTTDYLEALSRSQVCFLSLPTPSKEDGSCDLSFVFDAARSVAEAMQHPTLIVIKSTVPVGTCTQVKEIIQKHAKGVHFDLVSNPEFLKEGAAIADCMKPDRIILGVENKQSAQVMQEIYSAFNLNHDRILIMDFRSAEMTKYAANAMLATRISFMNELAYLCEKMGANINDVRIGIGSDARIGYQFLYPGLGYGGSCFPKDLRALQTMAQSVGIELTLIRAVDAINEKQKQILANKIKAYFKGDVRGKTIAVWGLSFKPDTDDIREAPSLQLIKELLQQGAILRLYDPAAIPNTRKYLGSHPNLYFCKDEYDSAQGAHAIALVTEWKQFRFVDFHEIQKKMENSVLFDGRNQYKKTDMKQKGFEYFAIGIPS